MLFTTCFLSKARQSVVSARRKQAVNHLPWARRCAPIVAPQFLKSLGVHDSSIMKRSSHASVIEERDQRAQPIPQEDWVHAEHALQILPLLVVLNGGQVPPDVRTPAPNVIPQHPFPRVPPKVLSCNLLFMHFNLIRLVMHTATLAHHVPRRLTFSCCLPHASTLTRENGRCRFWTLGRSS